MKIKSMLIGLLAFIAWVFLCSHCYHVPSFSKSYTVSGSISTTYSDTAAAFYSSGSGTATFTTASNFNGWKRYYFNGKTNNKAPLNFPTGAGNIYYYGQHSADKVTMNGYDTIWKDGTLDIADLVANNSYPGQENVIKVDDRVKIKGTWYYPGDTFFSTADRNPANKVLIDKCVGTVLPLNLISFTVQSCGDGHIMLNWKAAATAPVQVHYSTDGSVWQTLSWDATSPYIFPGNKGYNYVRIYSDGEYSPTERLILDVSGIKDHGYIYNLMTGERLETEPYYIPFYRGGRKEVRTK